MLNTEHVCEETVIPNQLQVIFELLTVLVEIYHKNVNSNEEVDFKQIKASEDFQAFLIKAAKLQRVFAFLFFCFFHEINLHYREVCSGEHGVRRIDGYVCIFV